MRIGIGLVGALLFVFVLGAVMFAPAVLYMMSYQDLDEPEREQLWAASAEQTIVTLSTAIANRLLIAALRRAAAMSGFHQLVNEHSAFAVCAFVVCVFNSGAPLMIAYLVANTDSVTVTPSLAIGWLFQVLCSCMLVTEVAGGLVPCWRYWTNYFWVRQSRYISVREAEPGLTAPDFPLATRYVDLLHDLTLVCTMVAIDSTSLYTVAACGILMLYCALGYFWDKYAFLRINKHTYYTSPRLDDTVRYLFVVPLTVLFICPLRHLRYHFVASREPWSDLLLLLGNALVFLAVVNVQQRCYAPKRELSDIPYVEVASLMPYNYFNTNPVHVLRTLHFPSIVVPPIYPHLAGKEYLQGGQFADYDDSVRLRETLMLLAKSPLQAGNLGNPQDR